MQAKRAKFARFAFETRKICACCSLFGTAYSIWWVYSCYYVLFRVIMTAEVSVFELVKQK